MKTIRIFRVVGVNGDIDAVSYEDHLATHEVDEEVERKAFEAVCPYRIDRYEGIYESQRTQDGWNMWIYRARYGRANNVYSTRTF